MAEVANGQQRAIEIDLCAAQPVMRPLKKPLQHAQLGEYFHRRGMHRIPPEIAEEVGVLFQHQCADTRAREQQSGEHPGRPPANNDDIRAFALDHGVTHAPLLA